MLHNAHSQISTSSGQVKALRAHGVVTAWSNCPLCMMANPASHLESLEKKIGWYSPGFIRHLFAQRFGKIQEFCCRYLKKKTIWLYYSCYQVCVMSNHYLTIGSRKHLWRRATGVFREQENKLFSLSSSTCFTWQSSATGPACWFCRLLSSPVALLSL